MTARNDRDIDDGVVADGEALDLRDPAPAIPATGSESVDLDNPFATGVAEDHRVSVTPATTTESVAGPVPAAAPAPKVAPPPVPPTRPQRMAEPEPVLDLTAVQPHSDEDLEPRQSRRRRRSSSDASAGFLPSSPGRLRVESVFVRLVATAGVIGIGTALGAILVANDVAGWITGLAVSALSVVLAAVLWRSRRL
jgi:hypothetical protein